MARERDTEVWALITFLETAFLMGRALPVLAFPVEVEWVEREAGLRLNFPMRPVTVGNILLKAATT